MNNNPTVPTKRKTDTIKAPIIKLSDIVALNTKLSGRKKNTKLLKNSPTKVSKLKARQVNIDPAIGNNTVDTKSAFNSIQQVINECHPDIVNFFNKATVKEYKVSPAHLLLKLDTGIRISITCLVNNKKKYKIIDTNGVILLDVSDK